jgi:CheY-like chemotaxis protein
MKEERERSLRAGCDDHLTKPIDIEVLVNVVASFALRRQVASRPQLES